MADTSLQLDFDRSLYAPAAVQAAVEAYAGYAESITVDEGPERLTVTLTGFDARYGDLIGDSFANHALFETVVATRQAEGGVSP